MTALASSSSPSSSPSPMKRRPKSFTKKCERACCQTVTYFPLAFVYGLTTWAIWVEAGIGFAHNSKGWTRMIPLLSSSVFMKLILACRRVYLLPGHHPLPSPKLVLYHRCLYRPRISSHIHGPLWLLAPSYPRTSFTPRCSLVHRQIYRREQILQEM